MNRCQCQNGCGMDNPHLWSSGKKIRILEQKLECLETKKKDIQEALSELKGK